MVAAAEIPVLLWTDDGPKRYADLLPRLPNGLRILTCTTEDEAIESADGARVLVHRGHAYPARLMTAAPTLEWVHNLGAGSEQWMVPEFLARQIPFTNSRGCNAPPVGEYVLGVILSFGRGLHRQARAQWERRWEPQFGRAFEVSDMTVGLIGYGALGREVASRVTAVGLRVIATRRDGSTAEGCLPLERVLAEADFLVIAVPLTPETRGLIDARMLALTKPGSYLINVSRGGVVVEGALLDALQSGHLAGAALDVFEVEPLPSALPFWAMPNVIVTAHSAAASPRLYARKAALVAENLRRFLDGKELLNRVDLARGY